MEKIESLIDESLNESVTERKKKTLSEVNTGINLLESINNIMDSETDEGLLSFVSEYKNALLDTEYNIREERIFETFISGLSDYAYLNAVDTELSAVKDRISKNAQDINLVKVLDTMKDTKSAYIVPVIEDSVVDYIEDKNPQTRVTLIQLLQNFLHDPFVRQIYDVVTLDKDNKAFSYTNEGIIANPIREAAESENTLMNSTAFLKKPLVTIVDASPADPSRVLFAYKGHVLTYNYKTLTFNISDPANLSNPEEFMKLADLLETEGLDIDVDANTITLDFTNNITITTSNDGMIVRVNDDEYSANSDNNPIEDLYDENYVSMNYDLYALTREFSEVVHSLVELHKELTLIPNVDVYEGNYSTYREQSILLSTEEGRDRRYSMVLIDEDSSTIETYDNIRADRAAEYVNGSLGTKFISISPDDSFEPRRLEEAAKENTKQSFEERLTALKERREKVYNLLKEKNDPELTDTLKEIDADIEKTKSEYSKWEKETKKNETVRPSNVLNSSASRLNKYVSSIDEADDDEDKDKNDLIINVYKGYSDPSEVETPLTDDSFNVPDFDGDSFDEPISYDDDEDSEDEPSDEFDVDMGDYELPAVEDYMEDDEDEENYELPSPDDYMDEAHPEGDQTEVLKVDFHRSIDDKYNGDGSVTISIPVVGVDGSKSSVSSMVQFSVKDTTGELEKDLTMSVLDDSNGEPVSTPVPENIYNKCINAIKSQPEVDMFISQYRDAYQATETDEKPINSSSDDLVPQSEINTITLEGKGYNETIDVRKGVNESLAGEVVDWVPEEDVIKLEPVERPDGTHKANVLEEIKSLLMDNGYTCDKVTTKEEENELGYSVNYFTAENDFDDEETPEVYMTTDAQNPESGTTRIYILNANDAENVLDDITSGKSTWIELDDESKYGKIPYMDVEPKAVRESLTEKMLVHLNKKKNVDTADDSPKDGVELASDEDDADVHGEIMDKAEDDKKKDKKNESVVSESLVTERPNPSSLTPEPGDEVLTPDNKKGTVESVFTTNEGDVANVYFASVENAVYKVEDLKVLTKRKDLYDAPVSTL